MVILLLITVCSLIFVATEAISHSIRTAYTRPTKTLDANKKNHLPSIISSNSQNIRNVILLQLRKLPEGLKNGLASGLSTIIAKSILQPFDTMKTLQQTSLSNLSPIQAVANIIKTRGILSLWSGTGITIIGSAPATSFYFALYSTTKSNLIKYIFKSPDNMNLLMVAISASIANTFASVIRAPFEVNII